MQEAEAEYGRKFSLGTYFTGLIHGLQPDALLVLLPALALPSGPAAAYLGTFLVRALSLARATYVVPPSSPQGWDDPKPIQRVDCTRNATGDFDLAISKAGFG